MRHLVFATSNAHKTREVAAILGDSWTVQDLRDHAGVVLPEETGRTFEENAVLKAKGGAISLPADVLILADDSGLEVDALDGEPGVFSARYAGPGATDLENRTKLKASLRALARNPGQSFGARFRCCMALVRNGEVLKIAHGTIEGKVLLQEQGQGGFGYDPLFVPDGHKSSFGVLPEGVKNALSHRASALAEIRNWLQAQADFRS